MMDNLISHLDNLVKIGEDDFVSMLSHTTLDKGADFVGIDFSESDLSYITFESYNFQSANFSKSDLSSSIFRKCDLRRADFRHCILENTLFENCQTDNALGISLFKSLSPMAFMSYVRLVDEHDHGRLTEFRERLSREVEVQSGTEFPIFQDRNDIKWGQNWKQRIDESLDEVTLLIPIITPSFFQSPACRDEMERFLDREKKLERNDLILPVYYVECPVLNDEDKRKADPLAEIIAGRQNVDWRNLRFEPLSSPQVAKALAQIAVQVRDALERSSPANKTVMARTRGPIGKRAGSEASPNARTSTGIREMRQMASDAEVAKSPSGRALATMTEPPTHVVDAFYRGDFSTITEALEAAKPGDRILVRPGLYEEGLVVEKPVEIIGDGEPGEILIRTTGKDCILFQTNMGRITNLVLHQMGDGKWFGVDIAQGRLELEDCDITSESQACVAIHHRADPRLRRNRIHDGEESGVYVYDNGLGTLEDNDIFGNAVAGVEIKEGGNPTLRRNRIHDGKLGGVWVYDNGQGTLEDNDIFGNAVAGVEIKEGSNPTLRRNRIHDGKEGGVLVCDKGEGTLEDNDIFRNALGGVEIREGSNPTLRRNRIHDGKQGGVLVHTDGRGALEENDIFGNAFAGITVREGGNPTVRRNTIKNNGREAIWIYEEGGGTFEDNDLTENARGPWHISDDSKANVKRSGNKEKSDSKE